jgi:hypothetical protein
MQREQPARRIEVHLDLSFETFAQEARAFVVQAAAPHVERFDLRGRRIADRLEVTAADEKIILDEAAKRRERQHDPAMGLTALELHIEDETILGDAQNEPVRPPWRSCWVKMISLQQVINRDLAFLLDLTCTAHDRLLVEFDGEESEPA